MDYYKKTINNLHLHVNSLSSTSTNKAKCILKIFCFKISCNKNIGSSNELQYHKMDQLMSYLE